MAQKIPEYVPPIISQYIETAISDTSPRFVKERYIELLENIYTYIGLFLSKAKKRK